MDGQYDLVIGSEGDWTRFGAEHLDSVVDPMIFRTADVYLRGARGAEETLHIGSETLWQAISSNIDSLISFFDAIILSERLPIIDYGITFDSDPALDAHNLYLKCNQDARDQVLFYVHVMEDAHEKARTAALEELARKPGPMPGDLAASVLQELSAFDYQWQPYLGDFEEHAVDGDSLKLRRFIYGFMLFSAFAQRARAFHLIQSKRSRLYSAVSAGAATAEDEEAILREVDEIFADAGYPPQDLRDLPAFLPYLLAQNPINPADLLRRALDLRHDPAVQNYRSWRTGVLREYRDLRRFSPGNAATVRAIQAAIRRRFVDSLPTSLKVNLSMKATLVPPSAEVGLGAELPAAQIKERLWGWIVGVLPGHRHVKLLTRMGVAARQYVSIDRHLRTLWNEA